MQETSEQALQRSEEEMAKLFPQTEATKLAAQAMTSPSARNKFYYNIILERLRDNDVKVALDALRQGLKQGFNVDYKYDDESGIFAPALLRLLVTASEEIDVTEMVKALLMAGANPNVRDGDFNRTPLHMITIYTLPAVIKELIEAGADVHAQDLFGQTPIMLMSAPERDITTLKDLGIEAVKKAREQGKITQEEIKQWLPQELQEELEDPRGYTAPQELPEEYAVE